MDLFTAGRVHESLSERVTVALSREMIAALNRVASDARITQSEVIREYIGESLPDGWVLGIGGEVPDAGG